MGFLHIFGR